jgi:hypothetical protein
MESEILEKTICVNCNEFDSCIKTRKQPVFFCEEYDNYTNVQKTFIAYDEESFINAEKVELHMNCDNRASCIYRNEYPEKLFCEEYR